MAMHNNMPGSPLVQSLTQQSLPSLVANNNKRSPKAVNLDYHNPMRADRTIDMARFEVREPGPETYGKSGGTPVTEEEEPTSNKGLLRRKLLGLADNLNDVVAVHHFYYDAVAAVMAAHELDIRDKSFHGLAITNRWLRRRDEEIIDALDDIRAWVRESTFE